VRQYPSGLSPGFPGGAWLEESGSPAPPFPWFDRRDEDATAMVSVADATFICHVYGTFKEWGDRWGSSGTIYSFDAKRGAHKRSCVSNDLPDSDGTP
jgi:hypothetical protein